MELQKVLFEPTLVRSVPQVVRWWERRRLFYNVVVGATGLVTIAATVFAQVINGELHFPPWQVIVVYGVLANICYSMGWAAELLIEKFMKRPVYGLGPALFRHGLVFSIGLTGLPAILMLIAGVLGWTFR